MPDVQEVFRMATQKIRPDEGYVDRQLSRQRASTRNRKLGAVALAAVIGFIGFVAVVRAMNEGAEERPADRPTDGIVNPGADPIPSLPGGAVEPGRYVFSSGDPALDATYEITIDVPDRYSSVGEGAVLKEGFGQTSVGTLAIGDVYVDPCRWQEGRLVNRSAISSTNGMAAALASQEGLRVSASTAATVDGFTGTYLERRVPKGTDVRDCDLGEFHVYRSGWGDRWLTGGVQLQRLWIVDVDGVPLVIDATIQHRTSRRIQAELEQMVASIQIDRRSQP